MSPFIVLFCPSNVHSSITPVQISLQNLIRVFPVTPIPLVLQPFQLQPLFEYPPTFPAPTLITKSSNSLLQPLSLNPQISLLQPLSPNPQIYRPPPTLIT
jgi:hypothetical protein